MLEMPNPPDAPCQCIGHPLASEGCICPPTERALRSFMADPSRKMANDQREWCLRQIESVEGYTRAEFDGASDSDIARGVIHAWTDYCRDKGVM